MKSISSKSKVPEFLHAKFIDEGYRANHTSLDALHSLFYFHNETMNIWTHFIGLICVLLVSIDFGMSYFHFENISNSEFIAVEIFLVFTAACLLFSCIYHIFRCVSEDTHHNLLRLDLVGVAFQGVGTVWILTHFGFHCVPDFRKYHYGICATMAIIGIINPWITYKINGQFIRPYILFGMACLLWVPASHWISITPSIYVLEVAPGFVYYTLVNVIGFTIFIAKVPEVYYPKSFWATQVFGSHTLWHVSNLLGMYTWYFYMMKYQSMLKNIGCSPYEAS